MACDSTCFWCAKHWWLWLKDREAKMRHGTPAFAEAAATSVRAPK